jgi:4-hydroxy-tetrahydrodipicolinate synthase
MKSQKMNWTGVIPAITTAFQPDYSVDHAFITRHAQWLVRRGCTGIVALGSLGESATLRFDEKVEILQTLVTAMAGRAPVVAGIASSSTREAVALAEAAEAAGCSGLMVLPPYIYSSDWREMKSHLQPVIRATRLSCMLYNNPVSYKTDFLPAQIAELAKAHTNLHAVKESSADVRRVTSLKALCGRLKLFVGVDDLIVEGVQAGATGWIAGLANAFPDESAALYHHALRGDVKKTGELYEWFLPLLRMDTVTKFVQLIKLVQQETGMGNERVRAPRCVLAGAERRVALDTIKTALKHRPKL